MLDENNNISCLRTEPKREKTPPLPDDISPSSIIGQAVKHDFFGIGEVIEANDQNVKINFEKTGTKTFRYPDAFRKWLEFQSEELNVQIKDYLDKVPEIRKIPIGHPPSIKTDPVESTEEYKKIEKELDEMIKAKIGERMRLGYCYMYWETKKHILKEVFGINWKSPSELNPHVLFD